MKYVLAIDQGTTSSRAMLFDEQGHVVTKAQRSFQQFFPENGWVEHDPEEIWKTVLTVCREVMTFIQDKPHSVVALGITNQRETTVVWDRDTGHAIYPAIVWQDRRTAAYCDDLKKQPGLFDEVHQKTGLLLDPYFSASKIHWILNSVEGARRKAEEGKLAFGTIDSFLLYRLTKGQSHFTDVTNAARTLLCNLTTLEWDQDLLNVFQIPRAILPIIRPNCSDFGIVDKEWLGLDIPVTGMAGDQQASAFGQACFSKGMVKATYGTGGFILVNTGTKPIYSKNRLLTTVLSSLNGETHYAIEGSIFSAGATVKWLHEKLSLITTPAETEYLAESLESNRGVYLVPAFTGLGAPYWLPEARAVISGMTRDTGKAEIARAALEAVCYQTRDLLGAIQADGVSEIDCIRVDGGMVANNWFLQFLTDMLNVAVERPSSIETTVRGAAFLAGLHVGFYRDLKQLENAWSLDRRFIPALALQKRESDYHGWKQAIRFCQEKKE